MKLGTAPEEFIWATGIEDTFVPQSRPGHRPLDEYELIGHYEHWREDLALARDLGVRALRWGVPWYRVEPQEGHFEWGWTDEVLPYLVQELGITPIIDLMHYGCPFWLKDEFANERYPDAVAAYAAAFARRYRGLVRWYTPLNEPLVNALLCGKRGVWPPYLRSDRGYTLLALQLARGISRTVDALREVDPDAVIVHVEATGLTRSATPELEPLATEEQWRNWLGLDLITGKVDSSHPLYPWLIRHGASYHHLKELIDHPPGWDVLGLNFYPQWTTRELYFNPSGMLGVRLVEKEGRGFAEIIRSAHERYGGAIMITETSARGSVRERAAWLDSSLGAIRTLRAEGVPVVGYTWFPLFTMIDWRYRHGNKPLESYYLDLGLYTLAAPESPARWQQTPLVERFCSYVTHAADAIGPLASNESHI